MIKSAVQEPDWRVGARVQIFFALIVFIIIAEIITSFVHPGFGFLLHAAILVPLLFFSSIQYREDPFSKFYLSLSLAPLIRIISLSVPLTFFPSYTWYIVVNIPLLIATIALMRVQGLGLRDVGIKFSKPLELVGITLTGIPLGFIDYLILRPDSLVSGLSFWDLIHVAIYLCLSTGFVEELVFRGILQKNAIEAYGERIGIIGVAAVFASLHIGWLSILDLVFVFSIGLFYGFIVHKTGNILGVTLSHGITNVVLFMVAPAITLI